MTITIFGGTGMVGKYVVRLALAKDCRVVAFGRNVEKLIDEDLRNEKLQTVKGYLFDVGEVYEALNGADAVISVLGGGITGADKTRSLGIKTIIGEMQHRQINRIVALGGAGVLTAPDGDYIINKAGYPEEYLAVGREHLQAYLFLKESNLEYSFFCAPDIRDKPSTGNYILSETYPPKPNKAYIQAGDLALAMVEETLNPKHVKCRIGISAQ